MSDLDELATAVTSRSRGANRTGDQWPRHRYRDRQRRSLHQAKARTRRQLARRPAKQKEDTR